ncbi:hypothetical protein QUF64_10790 [Anaerolineales bacterium HSG6]|nr:hypothetical protein [Anaerolineales bacterium HSG6]
MSQLMINEKTYTQFKRFAEQKKSSVELLAEAVIRDYIRREKREIMRQEIAAYNAMHTKLVADFLGQYVAIHQGTLIDHDQDELTLYFRINEKYPDIPILLRQVTNETEETITIRSPRFENV